MAVRIKDTTKADLASVPLPVYSGDTYTVISHQSVIDYALEQLTVAGFNVQNESYRCTGDGNIAQGIYHLTYNNDPEIGMMFAWSNSYNKQMRFKCAIGGYVMVCMNGMLTGDMGNWSRKHTGTADEETQNTIIDQITNAHKYYNQLISDKNKMKAIVLSTKEQSALLGILFAEYEILTTEQMSLVREQMNKPSFTYNAHRNSLWAFYNHVTLALKKSHPRTWMEDQRKLHMFVSLEFDLYNFNSSTEEVDSVEVDLVEDLLISDPLLTNPAQTNILDQIEEIESISLNKVISTGPNEETLVMIDQDNNYHTGPAVDIEELEENPLAPDNNESEIETIVAEEDVALINENSQNEESFITDEDVVMDEVFTPIAVQEELDIEQVTLSEQPIVEMDPISEESTIVYPKLPETSNTEEEDLDFVFSDDEDDDDTILDFDL